MWSEGVAMNMRSSILFPVWATLGALVGCAAQPATQAPQATAPGAATAAVAQDSPVGIGGYRRVMKDGVEYYCRAPVVTGSRMQRAETCMTKEQLEEMAEESEDFVRSLQGPVQAQGPVLDSPAGIGY
jgi:hypothetical protein